MPKKFIISLLFLLISQSLCLAQDMTVISIQADMSDLRASTNVRNDKKGIPCALLKIDIPSIEGITFSDNVIESTYTPGEYLVYVPARTKHITLYHPNYRPQKISFKEHLLEIESKVAYKVRLAPANDVFSVQVIKDKKSQYAIFELEPKDARLIINGETMYSQNGIINKLLPIGTYAYTIFAPSYHTNEDTITILKAAPPIRKKIDLKPMFGWVVIDGDDEFRDAVVSLNDSVIGQLPMKSGKLPSGMYSLKVSKPMYKSYRDFIVVNDAETTTNKVTLQRDFSDVYIEVEDGVEVWVNDTIRSIGSWHGRLNAGLQHIEAKRKNYKSAYKDVNIIPGYTLQKIDMGKLTPYLGTLSVHFEEGVDIWLDDQYLGKSPLNRELRQGVYKLTLRKDGYNDNVTSAIIIEGQVCSVWGQMTLKGREFWQTSASKGYDEKDLREFKVQSVVCIGDVDESPMNMFDNMPTTSFCVDKFSIPCMTDSIMNFLYSEDCDSLRYYNKCNLFVTVDCIQCMLDSMVVYTGDHSTTQNFAKSASPNAVVFNEPIIGAIQMNNEYEGRPLRHTRNEQNSPLTQIFDNQDLFDRGTTTIGLRFFRVPTQENVRVSELRIFGWPTLSWGHYEPYNDSNFLDK